MAAYVLLCTKRTRESLVRPPRLGGDTPTRPCGPQRRKRCDRSGLFIHGVTVELGPIRRARTGHPFRGSFARRCGATTRFLSHRGGLQADTCRIRGKLRRSGTGITVAGGGHRSYLKMKHVWSYKSCLRLMGRKFKLSADAYMSELKKLKQDRTARRYKAAPTRRVAPGERPVHLGL